MGAWYLERVTELVDFRAHLANLGCAQFADQITGQTAGYLTAVRPLPPPSGDQLLRGGLGFHVQ